VQPAFRQVFGVLGALFAGMSLVGLVQRTAHVGLGPSLQAFVQWWQSWTRPFASWALGWLPPLGLHIPSWGYDVFIISFVVSTWVARSLLYLAPDKHEGHAGKLPGMVKLAIRTLVITLAAFVLAITGVGFLLGFLSMSKALTLLLNGQGRQRLREARAVITQLPRDQNGNLLADAQDDDAMFIVRRAHLLTWAVSTVAAVCAFYAMNAFS
jgi:hypothetical protein